MNNNQTHVKTLEEHSDDSVAFKKRVEEEEIMMDASSEDDTEEEVANGEEEEKSHDEDIKEGFIHRMSYPTLGIKPKYKHTKWSENDEIGMSKADFIGNSCVVLHPIPEGFQEQEIYDFFSQVAPIRRMRIQRNHTTGNILPDAKAYIDFKHPDSAETIVESLDSTWVNETRIKLALDKRSVVVQEHWFNRLSPDDQIKLVNRSSSLRGSSFHPGYRDPIFNQALFKAYQRRLSRDEIIRLREASTRILNAREASYEKHGIKYETPLASLLPKLKPMKPNVIPPFLQFNQSIITMKLHPKQLGVPFGKQLNKKKRKRQQQLKRDPSLEQQQPLKKRRIIPENPPVEA